jgi:hypothetical protein
MFGSQGCVTLRNQMRIQYVLFVTERRRIPEKLECSQCLPYGNKQRMRVLLS